MVPPTAVCIANIFNIGLSRRDELTRGIVVKDAKGNPVGISKKAGRIAVYQVSAFQSI